MNNLLEEYLERKNLDQQNYLRYKKQYQSICIKTIFWFIEVFACYGIIFWKGVECSLYWIVHDNLTTMQFNKYVYSHYWYLLIVLLLAFFGKYKYIEYFTTKKAFERRLKKMAFDFKTKYNEEL